MRWRTIISMIVVATLHSPLVTLAAENTPSYPNQPVRFIVPFVAGGSYDAIARLVSKSLSEALGQQFVVDNRPGAGSLIGTELIAKAEPNGYTIGMFGNPQTIAVSVNRNATYNVERDFTPITPVAVLSNVLVIPPSVSAGSLKEFIALAKAKPGKLNFGSGGVGATSHLAGELFKTFAGVNLVHVPYKGAAVAMVDLLSGRVQFMVVNMIVALPLVNSGKLKALAVASAKRSPLMPDVPTASEAGLPGYEFSQWYGIVAPAGLETSKVNKLNYEIGRITGAPDFREGLARQGAEALAMDPVTFASFIKGDVAKYARIVKDHNIGSD